MKTCTGNCEQGRRCNCNGIGSPAEWYATGAVCATLILAGMMAVI